MKILVAATTGNANPLIRQLVAALGARAGVESVAHEVEPFWEAPCSADVVHIHWCEGLLHFKEPAEGDLERLEAQLAGWRACSRLVVTVHDRYPHFRDTAAFRRVFQIVYRACDGFIHMGQTSLDEFVARYPDLAALPQTIIPLGGIDGYFPNTVSQTEARQRLGIPQAAYAYISFGRLRSYAELELLLQGFRRLRMRDKHLLVAGPKIVFKFHRSRLMRTLYRRLLRHNPRLHITAQPVADEDVQLYLNAANVLVIPRLQILNSSNVVLGFGFGKVVVGPDDGNVGEILRETGNPVFDPRDPGSLAAAMTEARALEAQGKGAENLAYARTHWNWETIAEAHVAFFEQVMHRER